MKVLNLYAGIGGNRKYWNGVEVTAVELDPQIAEVYASVYPSDQMVVGDAHRFLQDHFGEYDFIWSSPPCPSHSQYRHNVGVLGKGYKPIMPDMSLYAEIVFLKTYATKILWVVENVEPYYTPLVAPSFKLQRHFFWSNFTVPEIDFPRSELRTKNKITDFDDYALVANTGITNKRQVLRNQTNPLVGQHIMRAILAEGGEG